MYLFPPNPHPSLHSSLSTGHMAFFLQSIIYLDCRSKWKFLHSRTLKLTSSLQAKYIIQIKQHMKIWFTQPWFPAYICSWIEKWMFTSAASNSTWLRGWGRSLHTFQKGLASSSKYKLKSTLFLKKWSLSYFLQKYRGIDMAHADHNCPVCNRQEKELVLVLQHTKATSVTNLQV